MRWFMTLILGAAGGFLAARMTMQSELDEFRKEMLGRNGRGSVAPPPEAPAPQAAPEPSGAPAPAPAPASASAEAPAEASASAAPERPPVDEATAMIIAAAVAAYLGKRAAVRRIRVLGHGSGDPWAVSGRISLQASHNVVQTHPHNR